MISKDISLVVNKANDTDFDEEQLKSAPDSFFNSIFVSDVLELSNDDKVLDNVLSKVKKSGVIKLSGMDGIEMCRRVYFGEIPIEASSDFFAQSKRINSLTSIRTELEKRGYKVLFAGVDAGRYLVEAKQNVN
jgi:hypothetical protein